VLCCVVLCCLLIVGEYQCAPLLADGSMADIFVVLNYQGGNKTTSTFAADMLLAVQRMENGVTVECFQYGGWNVKYETDCGILSKWPNSWNHHDSGLYTATADTARANFTGTEWQVCIGNGYTTTYVVGYEGTLDFTSSLITTGIPPTGTPTGPPSPSPTISPAPTQKPISQPTSTPSSSFPPSPAPTHVPSSMPTITSMPTSDPWTITSACGETMQMDFDVSLSGKQLVCADFPASDTLDIVNISMQFSGSSSGEWPYDMALVVKYIESSGIQIGGFNYYIPDISYVGPWPTDWRTTKSGSYTAEENVTEYGVSGDGYYGICIVNAWSYAKRVNYKGRVIMQGLNYNCDITPNPSSVPTSSPPSLTPTLAPTFSPTATPTAGPTFAPTVKPTISPTLEGETNAPTATPAPRMGIYQSSLPGENASVKYNMYLAGGE
jgi:hypothetical protein